MEGGGESLLDCQNECPTLAFRVGATCGVDPRTTHVPTTARATQDSRDHHQAIPDAVAIDGSLCADLDARQSTNRLHADQIGDGLRRFEVIGGSTPLATIDRFEQDIVFQSRHFARVAHWLRRTG